MSQRDYPLGPVFDFLQRLWQLNQGLEKTSSRMVKQLGITAQQRLIIRCVGKYPGLTAGQLARLLHLDPGTVSAALKRLERKALLERRKDPRDGRRASLGLTAEGRLLDAPEAGTVEAAVEKLLATVDAAHLSTATGVLDRLTRFLEADRAAPRQVKPSATRKAT